MLDFIQIEKTTVSLSVDPIAVLAIIIALASLIVSILSIVRDRPKVKIAIKNGWLIINPQLGYKKDTPYFGVSVSNAGIRPLTIASVGGKHLKDGGGFIFSDSMIYGSKELTQGKSTDCLVEQSKYDDINNKHGVLRLEITDLTGKTYIKNIAPLGVRIIFWPVRMLRILAWNKKHKKPKKDKQL